MSRNFMISEELFIALVKYHLIDDHSLESFIADSLQKKMDAISRHDSYRNIDSQYRNIDSRE